MTENKIVHVIGKTIGHDFQNMTMIGNYPNVCYVSNSSTIHVLKYTVFSGGEVYLDVEDTPQPDHIFARLQNSDDIFALVSLFDICNRYGIKPRLLTIPYFPYARQDRYTTGTNSFSLRWFCDLVNTFNVDYVTCYDPHSSVVPALVRRYLETPLPDTYLNKIYNNAVGFGQDITVIAPDAGGFKRAEAFAKKYSLPIATAIKERNPSTGNITKTNIFGNVNKTAVIIDDICDGGRTFTGLAKVLREDFGCQNVVLGVTHGIFSQGVDALLNNGIDKIVTTTSFVSKVDPFYTNKLEYAAIEVN